MASSTGGRGGTGGTGGTATVYSGDRESRLRIVLWVVLVAAAVAAVVTALGGGPVLVTLLLVLAVLAAGWTLRILPARDRTVRLWAVSTGTYLGVIGVLLVTYLLGWLALLLGIAVLALALLPDEPAEPTP